MTYQPVAIISLSELQLHRLSEKNGLRALRERKLSLRRQSPALFSLIYTNSRAEFKDGKFICASCELAEVWEMGFKVENNLNINIPFWIFPHSVHIVMHVVTGTLDTYLPLSPQANESYYQNAWDALTYVHLCLTRETVGTLWSSPWNNKSVLRMLCSYNILVFIMHWSKVQCSVSVLCLSLTEFILMPEFKWHKILIYY